MSEADETARRLLQQAQLDQSEAALGALGTIAGNLYGSLAAQMPSNLAATLTRDWFFLALSRSLWPEHGPPQSPYWDTLPPEPPRGDE